MKLEKLMVSKQEQDYNENWCRRCDKYYCVNCVDFQVVEFDIEEVQDEVTFESHLDFINWKGEAVCIWCYNQLVDKFNTNNPTNKKKGDKNEYE